MVVAGKHAYGLTQIVFASVCASCVYNKEVNAVAHGLSVHLAVPSAVKSVPRIYLRSPAVKHSSLELNDALISVLGLQHVIITVAVGRKGVGKFKFAFADGHTQGIVLSLGRIRNGVSAQHKGGIKLNAEGTALGKGVLICQNREEALEGVNRISEVVQNNSATAEETSAEAEETIQEKIVSEEIQETETAEAEVSAEETEAVAKHEFMCDTSDNCGFTENGIEITKKQAAELGKEIKWQEIGLK